MASAIEQFADGVRALAADAEEQEVCFKSSVPPHAQMNSVMRLVESAPSHCCGGGDPAVPRSRSAGWARLAALAGTFRGDLGAEDEDLSAPLEHEQCGDERAGGAVGSTELEPLAEPVEK